ncbi:fibronectin type III domain-containing protein [Microlunatus flavus]|uniref:Metal-dependent hydrolase, endonuclease/exonuclease/phosphatase family n=1 Tax=Microlunatus flavus TaxID=1036181 RepID=A0A1H9NSU9_9ACTN|nr:fibronectin type III domain-containing protein [Microlunatus flavus]SER39124.1 Metal-dependent hydrolase, endonuclease/exonuclease/phosphatase family [Microlunatus flavus]
MSQPVHQFQRVLHASSRRVPTLLLALLLALGALGLSAAPADAATKPPAGLKVSATGATTLKVTFSKVKGAPKYRVAWSTKKSMAGASYKRSTATTVELAGLKPSQRYYVKVRVISTAGKALSKYSKAVSAKTSAGYAAPSGLKVTGTGRTSLALAWGSRGKGLTYRVQYATTASMAGASYKRFKATAGSITGLQPGTTYYVKVRVITSTGENLGPYSKPVKTATTKATTTAPSGSAQLRLGTFNVKCFNCEGDHPNERSWWDRRAAVVKDIKSQKVDVLGIQEASQAWLPAREGGKGQDLSQFEDLRNRLGGSWKVTNSNRNNCVKAKTPTRCVYKDQGASKGTRILFDNSRVALLSQGSKLLPSPEDDRFMAWAVFRQRSTGKKFFFATAHLEPDKDWNLHVKEATTVAKEVAKRNPGHLPTFITGDMNAHKNSLDPSGKKNNPVAKVFVAGYGYVDPLGNASGSTTATPGATVEKRINTPLSSFNDFMPEPSPNYFGRRPNGTYIDYILTSKKVRVLEWENVAHLDANHRYVGKQASDHNMQRATVVLP